VTEVTNPLHPLLLIAVILIAQQTPSQLGGAVGVAIARVSVVRDRRSVRGVLIGLSKNAGNRIDGLGPGRSLSASVSR
jgi:hypothetical protein